MKIKILSLTLVVIMLFGFAGCGKKEQEKIEGIGEYTAVITVKDYGKIEVLLDGDTAPITVENFVNLANRPFDMFKPVAGVDLIQVTKDFFAEGYDPDTVTGATYVEIQSNGTFKAVVSPTSEFAGLQFKIFAKQPIIIANGSIAGEGVDAWILECTIN